MKQFIDEGLEDLVLIVFVFFIQLNFFMNQALLQPIVIFLSGTDQGIILSPAAVTVGSKMQTLRIEDTILIMIELLPIHCFPVIELGGKLFKTHRIHLCKLLNGFSTDLYFNGILFRHKKTKKYQEKYSRSKNIHPYRIEVTGSSAKHIFPAQESGLKDQVFQTAEKFSIKVSDILKKMSDQMPNRFIGLNILLSTYRTIFPFHFSIAVQAICSFPYF